MVKKKPVLSVGDKCRIRPAPPVIDCEGIKNNMKCKVIGFRPHTVYVRLHKIKGLFPVYPKYLVKIREKTVEANSL